MKIYCAAILLLLSGCAVGPQKAADPSINVSRLPVAIIGFSPNSSKFNNVTNLKAEVANKGVVLVAHANNSSLTLAEERLRAIAKRLVDSREVFASYRYSSRNDDLDLIEVFTYQTSEEVAAILTLVNSQSLDTALGIKFTEQHTRDFEFQVRRQTIFVPAAASPADQLAKLVEVLGWQLRGVPVITGDAGERRETIPHELDVIFVDPADVTVTELQSVIDNWLRIYGVAENRFSVALDQVSKTVEISQ